MELYVRDEHGIFTGAVVVDPFGPLPPRVSQVMPPVLKGSQVARWTGREWEVLASRPAVAEPAPAVPVSVTRGQARKALFLAGLLDKVPAAIAALPSPDRELAQIDWADALVFERFSRLVAYVGAALGLDEAGLDALFIHAATL